MVLEYRVLGALQVLRDGAELHVGGPRQRRLPAALLLHADEVVSTDRLVEAVFAGSPTARAATTLRTHVVRLRRVLDGDDEESVLATHDADLGQWPMVAMFGLFAAAAIATAVILVRSLPT